MKIPESIITKKPEDGTCIKFYIHFVNSIYCWKLYNINYKYSFDFVAHTYLSGGNIDFDSEKIIIEHPQLNKSVEFSLFDKVEVLLETDESRSHRNSVVMSLIQKVNTNVIAPQVRIDPQELMKDAEAEQDNNDGYITDKPIEINKENKIYQSKENSIYQI